MLKYTEDFLDWCMRMWNTPKVISRDCLSFHSLLTKNGHQIYNGRQKSFEHGSNVVSCSCDKRLRIDWPSVRRTAVGRLYGSSVADTVHL